MSITHAISNFKIFASYLAENQVDIVADRLLQLTKQEQHHLPKVYMSLSDEEIFSTCRENLELFLLNISQDNACNAAQEYFYRCNADASESRHCLKTKISLTDIVLFSHIHKQLLLQFLPLFTVNVSQAIRIACEIENYFAKVESELLNAYEKEQQEALIKNQHLLKEAQEIAHVGSWEWHLASDEVIFSDEMYRIFDLSPDKVNIDSQTYIQLLHPDEKESIIAVFHNCIDTGQPFSFQHQVVCGNGTTRWVLCKGKAIINTDNKVERLVGASIDITEQKQIENRLQEANEDLLEKGGQLGMVNEELEQLVSQRTSELLIAVRKIRKLLDREKKARFEADNGRKQVEELFMQAPVAVGMYHGTEFIVDLANEAMCKIWRCTHAEVIDKPLFEALPRLTGVGYKERLTNVFLSGNSYIDNEIAVNVQKEGIWEQIYLKVVHQAIRNSDGKITGIITVAHEVTSEVVARKKVEESEARVLRILDSMPQIAWTANREGKNTFLNQKWYEFSGADPATSFNDVAPIIIHKDDEAQVHKQWRQSVETGEPLENEYRIRCWNGEYHWVLVRALPLRNASNIITEWVGTATDIHDQKQKRDFLYMVLEAIPHLAWTSLPEKSSVNYYNKRWYQYTALTEDQSFGSGWQHVLHPDDFALTVERITEGRRYGQPWEVENRYLKAADGTYRWHLSRAVPIRDENGIITIWVGTATDIHDQKMAQHKLEHTLNALNEKNFELDQFVYKTSHDLRAPLSTILGLVTILKQEKEEAAKTQYVCLIENRVHKLDKFINSMLDYSRNTRTGITCQKVNLEELIHECVHDLEYMKHFERLKFDVSIEEKEIYTDVFRLKIIFSNLISNSIKYQDFAKQQSNLSIKINTDSKKCSIQFVDNGIGIEQAYQDRIFNMFFRASENSDGSGLGLYIVKQALGALNGTIFFDSKIGIGTEFNITLPLAEPVIICEPA